MIEGYGSVTQTLLGTLFTWGMTAAGASIVLFIRGTQRKLLDASLGFAAGVMTAASYWSLLSPAIDLSKESGLYGENGEYAFLPVAVGFLLGAIFVYGTDVFLDYLGINTTNMMLAMTKTNANSKNKIDDDGMDMDHMPGNRRTSTNSGQVHPLSIVTIQTENLDSFGDCINNQHLGGRQAHRRRTITTRSGEVVQTYEDQTANTDAEMELRKSRWKRIMLLVVAITVHNIPEGLAVGVGFGAIGTSSAATFQAARKSGAYDILPFNHRYYESKHSIVWAEGAWWNLAIGIGIQNFPEGLAVSLPLQAAGFSVWRSLWYGQLSGMVEPVFGVLGAVAVAAAQPVLPYALAFAAGAMIYVVADDIIPEANTGGNGKIATWGCIVGFLVMMCLDVGTG